jgi:hypothetical protein
MRIPSSVLLALLISSLAMGATSAPVDNWSRWEVGVTRTCPGHHVNWIFQDGHLALIEGFEPTLSNGVRRRLVRLEDFPHRCASEVGGFACEFGAALAAYARVGLMRSFVAYSCRHVKCEEPAVCTTTLPPL